jgi:hypothetical protein
MLAIQLFHLHRCGTLDDVADANGVGSIQWRRRSNSVGGYPEWARSLNLVASGVA